MLIRIKDVNVVTSKSRMVHSSAVEKSYSYCSTTVLISLCMTYLYGAGLFYVLGVGSSVNSVFRSVRHGRHLASLFFHVLTVETTQAFGVACVAFVRVRWCNTVY